MATAKHAAFDTTQWSLVLAAGGDLSAPARHALSTLCEIYWYPLYAYVRRQGYSSDDAQDLTQAFLLRLLDKQNWRDVRPELGRFRSFLLAAMKHFLANARQHDRRLKRGGAVSFVPLDFGSAEGRYAREPAALGTPEDIFTRRWALTILDRVFDRLRTDAARLDALREFEALKSALSGDLPHGSYAAIGADIGMTEGAVKTAVHRLRRRFQRALREEIAQTVADPAEIDDEIRSLLAALS